MSVTVSAFILTGAVPVVATQPGLSSETGLQTCPPKLNRRLCSISEFWPRSGRVLSVYVQAMFRPCSCNYVVVCWRSAQHPKDQIDSYLDEMVPTTVR